MNFAPACIAYFDHKMGAYEGIFEFQRPRGPLTGDKLNLRCFPDFWTGFEVEIWPKTPILGNTENQKHTKFDFGPPITQSNAT